MNRIRVHRTDPPLSLMLKYNAAWLASLILMGLAVWWLEGR